MSRIAEDLADRLARDTLRAAAALDDDGLIEQVAQAIGASSPTTEEMFRTLIRVRTAEARARRMLDQRLAAAGMAPSGEAAPPDGTGGAR